MTANWPAFAELAKITPAILLLETVVANIKGRILTVVKPQDSSRIVDDRLGTHVTVKPGDNNTSVTWSCPVHQATHTVIINHQSPDFAEVTAAGRSMGVLSSDSEPIAISPEVDLEWVE